MSILEIALSAFIISFSGAMMPGPVTIYTINASIPWGFWAGPGVAIGHGFLEALLLVLIILGLGHFLTNNTFNGIVSVSGAILLILMAVGMLRQIRTASLNLGLKKGSPHLPPPIAGILLSLSNPYWFLWWATIGLNYLSLSQSHGAMGIITFFCAHLSADLIWLIFISTTVTSSRHFLTDQIYRVIIFICALGLTGFGLMFGFNGIRKLI